MSEATKLATKSSVGFLAGKVLGLLSESHVRRRYAEELEKTQADLFGER